MKINSPFSIGSRLLPALQVGDGAVSLEPIGTSSDGRTEFRWYIDTPNGEFSGDDLRSGVGGCSTQSAFESLLSFLSAAAESYAYRVRTGRDGDNEDLFPAPVVEWAHQNSDEISMLSAEIEETQGLIED